MRVLSGAAIMGIVSEYLLACFRSARWITAAALVTVLFLPPVPGSAAGPAPVFVNVSSPAEPSAIPPAQIALRATEVSAFLRTYAGNSADDTEVDSIRQSLPEFSREIETQFRETMLTLRGHATLSGLQSQQQMWHQNRIRATAWLIVLTNRAGRLDAALDSLAGLQKTWTLTLEAARTANAPRQFFRQIEATLAAIASARAPLQAESAAVIDLQGSLARSLSVCGNALGQISHAQQSLVRGTFLRNSPPIWSARQWEEAKAAFPSYSREVGKAFLAELRQYSCESPEKLLFVAVLAGIVLSLLLFARQRVRQWETTDKAGKPAFVVFEHPYCASVTVLLLALTGPFSQTPTLCKVLLQAVSIAPMILLVRSSLSVRFVPWLCVLGILFAVDTVRQAFSGIVLIGQAILVFESIVVMGVVGLMIIRKDIRRLLSPACRADLPWLAGCLLLPYFAVCLVAGAAGYTNLARLLGPSVLVGGYLGLALYTSVRVLNGMVAFSFHAWPLRRLIMVRQHRDFLEKRCYLVLVWGAVFVWLLRFLDYMGFLQPSIDLGKVILAAKFERGAIAVSLGDALAFGSTVWVAYLLSACLRFVLKEEVYPRFDVGTGRSYAVSSLLHYFILALGFTVGIGLMGVNLTKVTVLAGALGVGIGFGLQSVVNNFVSGLILLFERPVSAGDSIEVGELLGEVRRIGMRSSTIRTWKGADIIVPNSQLVSEKVTNWTLSDRKRRIDLPVGVNYGSEPKELIRLLVEAAGRHPEVLKDPPPQCLLVGYGDSSINFELRAWTDQFNDWPRIRSDLAVAVYEEVNKAGLTFPFPQRDVHLVNDSPPVSTPVAPARPPAEE